MSDFSPYRDRRDYSSGGGGRGGGSHGGYRGFRGSGGSYRGHHPYRGSSSNHYGQDRGGRGGGGRHSRGPYRGDGGERGSTRPPNVSRGNRFAATDPASSQDPMEEMFRSLVTMIHAVGITTKPAAAVEDASSGIATGVRPVVRTQARHIEQLTSVLVQSSTSTTYFQHSNDSDASLLHHVGPLAAALVETASFSPVQGPCLAALTLSLHEHRHYYDHDTSGGQLFSHRALSYAMASFARDLDLLLLVRKGGHDQPQLGDVVDLPRTMVRLRLSFQYIVLLAKLGMVQVHDQSEPVDSTSFGSMAPLSLKGLLCTLVRAAERAVQEHANFAAAAVLSMTVLNAIPWLHSVADLSVEWIQDTLLDPLRNLMQHPQGYRSDFTPGVGRTAILLQADQRDDMGGGIGDENVEEMEEKDDEDEEDTDEESSQVCDTLQDLFRAVSHWIGLQDDKSRAAMHYTPFTDAPWEVIKHPNGDTDTMQGEDCASLRYTNSPVKLDILPVCSVLRLLLAGDQESDMELSKFHMDGLVFGRLPIFGSPPDVVNDEGDEDNDDEMPDESLSNIRLEAYKKQFGLVDRYFLAQAVRDIILMQESCMTPAGVERGGAKFVAEMLWSLASLATDANDDKGIEYLILESILSLVAQSSSTSPFRPLYLWRVILEVTRLAPSVVSPAVALAVAFLFQDYMPALVPAARYNLSQWFAFHLTNTDYQWPAAYWKHWEPFVMFGWRNSRGAFVKTTLALMAENLSQPDSLIQNLPRGCALLDNIFPVYSTDSDESGPYAPLIRDLMARVWDNGEDSSRLLSYMLSDEVFDPTRTPAHKGTSSEEAWLRTFIWWKAAAAPAREEYKCILEAMLVAKAGTGSAMSQDGKADSLSKLLALVHEYKEMFTGVIAQDAGQCDNNIEAGELYLLSLIDQDAAYSRAQHESILSALILEEIVQPLSILKWCLGDSSGNKDSLVLRWWEIASLTIRLILTKIVSASTSGSAMEVSHKSLGTGQAEEALGRLEPLLSYVVRRVCSLVPNKDNGTRSLSAEQVELVEGLKSFVSRAKAQYVTMMETLSKGRTRSEVEAIFLSSMSVRQSMASLGIDARNATAGLLHCWRILESI